MTDNVSRIVDCAMRIVLRSAHAAREAALELREGETETFDRLVDRLAAAEILQEQAEVGCADPRDERVHRKRAHVGGELALRPAARREPLPRRRTAHEHADARW